MDRLSNNPIVEAVLDIDCDLPPSLNLSTLETAGRALLCSRYPKFRIQRVFEHRFEAKPGASPEVASQDHVAALQFLQEDEKQLVQFRLAGFSFNRLVPYTILDDYLTEIENAWSAFVELATPVQVRVIRLRYINRILLPALAGTVRLDDYLKVAPRLPDEVTLSFRAFFNQHAAVETQTGYEVNIVLTNQAVEEGRLPIILDNTVAAKTDEDPKNWPSILATIQALRVLQNHIFKKTLTEKCLSLFQ